MNTDLIQVENGKIFVTSIAVADKFEKQHFHVLRDIDDLVSQIEGVYPNLDIPPLFEKSSYVHEQNGQVYPMYQITRDGFVLLAMGFTGSKALEWKLKYIAAFNAMEQKLRDTPTDNRLDIARLIVDAPARRLKAIQSLYPEYFYPTPAVGSLEYYSDLNTSYQKWVEDFGITKEWLETFPTTDVYLNYVRYCTENRMQSMGKKIFYQTLENDFNMIRRQKSDGNRYFLTA